MPNALGLALPAVLGGCSAEAWPLAPAGPLAERLASLWWVFFSVTAAVWLVVLTVVAWAVLRGRRRLEPAVDPATTKRQARVVAGAVGLTLVLLFGLAFADYLTVRAMSDPAGARDPLTIEVTGQRWWWELTYEPDDLARRFKTANEIRIPVGRPVLLRLKSQDVIHSFWVPRLQGKRDLVPGYTNTLWIEADEPGLYRGGCAEFCGLQHAKMRLLVIAEPPDRFDAWYARQLMPAAPPADSVRRHGRDVFEGGPCALCHTIRGTAAFGSVGPDLTHLGSRLTLAAGVLPNTRGHLGGWIVNPQTLKPGAQMPPNLLPAGDLQALLSYLEGLE